MLPFLNLFAFLVQEVFAEDIAHLLNRCLLLVKVSVVTLFICNVFVLLVSFLRLLIWFIHLCMYSVLFCPDCVKWACSVIVFSQYFVSCVSKIEFLMIFFALSVFMYLVIWKCMSVKFSVLWCSSLSFVPIGLLLSLRFFFYILIRWIADVVGCWTV